MRLCRLSAIGMVIGSLTTSEADKAFDVIAALIDGATLFYDTARRPHLDVT